METNKETTTTVVVKPTVVKPTVCVHQWIWDLIDITPDKSKYIY